MARILIIDATSPDPDPYGAALQAHGHNVVRARTADAAFVSWWSSRFDVVVLDLDLPEGEGQRILNVINQTSPDSAVPVIVVGSQDSNVGLSRRATRLTDGARDSDALCAAVERLLTKPF